MRTTVIARRDSFRLPSICAGCLGRAERTLSVDSGEKTKADYLIVRKVEHLNMAMPFCRTCAQRRSMWVLLYLLGTGMLVISIVAALLLDNNFLFVGVLVALSLLVPGIYMRLKDRVIVVSHFDAETLTLKISGPEYAKMVAQVNDSVALDEGKPYGSWTYAGVNSRYIVAGGRADCDLCHAESDDYCWFASAGNKNDYMKLGRECVKKAFDTGFRGLRRNG